MHDIWRAADDFRAIFSLLLDLGSKKTLRREKFLPFLQNFCSFPYCANFHLIPNLVKIFKSSARAERSENCAKIIYYAVCCVYTCAYVYSIAVSYIQNYSRRSVCYLLYIVLSLYMYTCMPYVRTRNADLCDIHMII